MGVDAQRANSKLLRSALNLLTYLIIFSLTIRYAVRKSKEQNPVPFNISFNKIQGWLIPVLIITTLALVVGLERISEIIPIPKVMQKIFETAFTKDIFSVITTVIVGPILEEILCRGIILKGLLKNYGPYKAILISATFFSVMHLNPWQALPAFFGGLFLGWVFYKTQSVIPGIIIHATINSTAMVFLFLPQKQQDLSGLVGIPYFLLYFFAIAVFTVGCLIINKKSTNVSTGTLIE